MNPAATEWTFDDYANIPPTFIRADRTDQQNLIAIKILKDKCYEQVCYYNEIIRVMYHNLKELKKKIKSEQNGTGNNSTSNPLIIPQT